MVRPIGDNLETLAASLIKAGLAIGVDRTEESDNLIRIYMNSTLKELLDKRGYPVVPLAGHYDSFYDCVVSNLDWMKEGRGEGLVLAMDIQEGGSHVSKWKIGMESGETLSVIMMLEEILDEDKENKVFGDYREKTLELNDMLGQV